MGQTISFINMKGGVGKTTMAVNVAYGLAYVHKKQVLLVDCDPQFNATQYLLEDQAYLDHISDNKRGTLRDIFVPRRAGQVSTVHGTARGMNKSDISLHAITCNVFDGGANRGKLDLIPSTLALMDIETAKRNAERRLKNFLAKKAAGYDYVIIDCPPTISIFTQAAVLASDKYIVPIKPDPLSVTGLPLLESALDEYSDDAGIQLESIGLVFTLVRGPTPSVMKDVIADLRNRRGNDVFDSIMSVGTDVAKSVESHKPVFLHRPGCKTATQALAITKEFLDRTSGG